MNDLHQFFQQHFGTRPSHVVRAPGRVELLGNHTDYNQGLVMALAVDKYISLAVSPRDDGWVEIRDLAFPEVARFPVAAIEKDPAIPWANYPKGLLRQLQQRGLRPGGFNAAIQSSVPLGAGLSSSAALLVATALATRALYPYDVDASGGVTPVTAPVAGGGAPLTEAGRLALAQVCQAAENQFVGVNCGLLDHLSSLFGKAWQVIQIDCQRLTVDWSPLHGDVDVVVCHSGVKHALVGGEYNDRRRHCESAARALGVPSLRQASIEMLDANRSRLERRDYECALHVVGEIQRVAEGSQLLDADRLTEFGQLLFASHASSRDYFLNSCPELDRLVELARANPACLGARLTGGGFGGATVNLVRRDAAEGFRREMSEGYRQSTGKDLQSWICQVVDGAQ
ncbi:MAG: galactokinase [Limisphaerales bacterium]